MEYPAFISGKPGFDGSYPVNLYFTIESSRGKPALKSTPGLVRKVTPLANVPVRALTVCNGKLYAVCGDRLFSITREWLATEVGAIADKTGFVPIVSDERYVVFRSGSILYVYDTVEATLSTPTTNVTPRALTQQDRYFIISKERSNFWYVSTLGDPSSWDATEEGRAAGTPGFILAMASEARQIWVFKEDAVEVYYNSGDVYFPFQRVQGAHQEIGIAAEGSLASLDKSLFWLDSKHRVVRSNGYSHEVISTPEIERQIASYENKSDAIGYSIYWQGHAWYVLTFASANKTWCYDASTQSWFQWSSKKGLQFGGRHRGNCYAFFDGYHVIGDFENGKIYTLDANVYTEDGEPIRWERRGQPIYGDGRRYFFPEFVLDMKTGTTTDHTINPQVMLKYSDDDCRTWSSEYWASVGRVGQYKTRVVWRRLGSSFNRTFHIAGTDRYPVEIYGAYLRRVNASRET